MTNAAGAYDGMLKVRVAAPPVDNAANEELCRYLAKVFNVPQSAVEIIGGQTSKTKSVKITGATREQLSNLTDVKR